MQSIVYYSARIYFFILVSLSDSLSQTTYFPVNRFHWRECVRARPTIAINSRYIIIISGCCGDGTGTRPKDILSSDCTSTSSHHNIHVIFSLLSSSSFSVQQKKKNEQTNSAESIIIISRLQLKAISFDCSESMHMVFFLRRCTKVKQKKESNERADC